MFKTVYRGIATAGGIGYLPLAPGTWAAMATTILWFLLKNNSGVLNGYNEITCALLICIIGIVASGLTIKEWGKDPSKVVIDEVAGMSISLLTIPLSVKYYTLAFILFRFFDILKPLGIKQAEKAGGGFGIMLDDIFAGIYSLLILKLIIYSEIL